MSNSIPPPPHLPRISVAPAPLRSLQPPPVRSRARRTLFVAAALLAAVALAYGVVAFARGHGGVRTVRIATGLRGGVYLPIGQALATTFNHDVSRVRATAVESSGGDATVRMLQAHQAELGLISNNVRGGDAMRLIAPLYEETLQVVVRDAANIRGPLDLRGKRVSVGAHDSGTEAIAEQILRHFGLTDGQFDRRSMGNLEAADAMEQGQLDAVFIVAGMRTPVVDRLLRHGDMHLLSLGDTSRPGSALEGIRIDAPYYVITVIPERTYGEQPLEPVGTVSVKALLVARVDMDDDLVQDLTQALFANKVRLADREHLLARLSEHYDPAESPFPIHVGADRYYRRDDPSFVQKYSDQISLALTVSALLWSAFTALREVRRRNRRGRIESFYVDAQALAGEARVADTLDAVRSVRERLEVVRSRAVAELTAERLEANESFTILSDYLNAQIAEADRAMARGVASANASEQPA